MTQNSFEQQFDRRRSAANRAFGITVVLQRGDVLTTGVTARRAPQEYELFGTAEESLSQLAIDRVFMIAVSEYKFGGVEKQPVSGDRVVDGDEIFALMNDETAPASELSGTGTEWICRTKQVK